jgi:heme-degrading monooxygenase HmoA
MYITFTGGKVTPEESRDLDKFLADFLPRLKRQRGVLAAYQVNKPDKGEEVTIIVWENEEAVKAYRQSELFKEPMAFEKAHNMNTTREGYPVVFGVSDKIGK